MKFGRRYTMAVDGRTLDEFGDPETHYISFPLTCIFQIIKDVTFNTGTGLFRIYNLAAETRADIYRDIFELGDYRGITFAAGYDGEELPQIFQGNIKQAFSYRQGPDWITEIEAYDGGDAVENTIANITLPSHPFPYNIRDLALSIIGQFENADVGVLGNLQSGVLKPSRGITVSGNAWDLITRSIKPFGGFAFINNEKVNIVNQWEYIVNEGGVEEINSDTGMIGTPKLQASLVNVKLIFEPRLEPQQKVHLTTLESRMTGDYTVSRLVHQGTISGAICEDLTTEATLFQPNRVLTDASKAALEAAGFSL